MSEALREHPCSGGLGTPRSPGAAMRTWLCRGLIAAAVMLVAWLAVYRLIVCNNRVQLIGSCCRRVATSAKVVALTYDDGPLEPYTNQLLDVLENHRVKATFFFEGNQIAKNPALAERVCRQGHQLANHAYYHVPLVFKTPATVRSHIEATDALLRAVGVDDEICFRAPYGRKFLVLPYVLQSMGKKHILFDVDACDWEGHDQDDVVNRVLKSTMPGSIILLHDGSMPAGPQVAETTDRIISSLKAKGYEFKTVFELLRYEKNQTAD